MSKQVPGGPSAVLLVDDNPTDAHFMKTIIERAGDADVTVTNHGDTGASLIVSREWACAIIDLVLPGKDGIELIQAGRKKHPDLPIIVVSASSNETLLDAAFRAGAEYCLSKPIDPEEMLSRIREYISVGEPDSAPTVLAVGACPGDLETGCGGALFNHRAEGNRIAIVNLAGGGDPHSDLAGVARLAAEMLDAQMENVGEDANHVADLDGATDILQAILETSKPAILYLPTACSDRPSSVESHRLALALAEAVPNVLAYQGPRATVDFRPQYFIDLAPQLERKLELVSVYERFGMQNVSSDLARATALFWGRFADSAVAEPFEIIRRASA